MNGVSGFPKPRDVSNRQRWVKGWRSDSVDRKTVEHDLYAASKRLVDAMHQKYDVANDSLESEHAEDGLIRVDLSNGSSSVEVLEDAQEQNRPVETKETRREVLQTSPSEDCETFHQGLLLAPAPSIAILQLDANKDCCRIVVIHDQPLTAAFGSEQQRSCCSRCMNFLMMSPCLSETKKSIYLEQGAGVSAFASALDHSFRATLQTWSWRGWRCHFALDICG